MSRREPHDFDTFDITAWLEQTIARPEVVRVYGFGSRITGHRQPRTYDAPRRAVRMDSDFDVLVLLDPACYQNGDGAIVEGMIMALLRRRAKPVHVHFLRPDGTMAWIGNYKLKRPMPGDRWRQLRLVEEEGKLLYTTDPYGPPPYPPVGRCGGLPVALGQLRPLAREEWRR